MAFRDYVEQCSKGLNVLIPCPSILDVALFKKTAQSSTIIFAGSEMISHKAVDGIATTSFSSSSCTHTKADAEPWWMVDFGKVYNITGVEITNRGDCCGDRLKNFDVTVDGNLLVKIHSLFVVIKGNSCFHPK